MEIQMIGHASIFVKTKDCRILMDPVLWDPFMAKTNEVCPKREVIHEQIPEFDFLIISHRHLDHFDSRTLAHLPKTVDVLIPKDKVLENCLRQLGYSQIYPLKDFGEVRMGSTSLFTTRSEERVPEYGLIITDESGVFWNHVDTVVSWQTIKHVLSRYSKIDFLLAKWQPMIYSNYQLNQSLSFPYSEYNQLLDNISLIQPKAIAPGSNGFKHVNELSWLNQITFPVTREQFCQDVSKVCPEIGKNIFALDPGDILTFSDNKFCHSPKLCEYVRKIEDNRESLDFCPVNIGSSLKDDNLLGHDLDSIKEVVEEEILYNFPKFINESDNLFLQHQRWNIIYQFEVVFPEGCQKYFIDFSEENLRLYKGRNPLANFFTFITASSLYNLLQGTVGWDWVMGNGYYRTYHKIYSVTPLGITYPDSTREVIQDPLVLRFSTSVRGLQPDSVLYRELEKWASPNIDNSKSTKGKSSMIKMGDVLLKPTKQPR